MRLGKPANCIIVYIIGSALIYTVGYIIIIIVIALAQQLQAQNGHGSIFPAEFIIFQIMNCHIPPDDCPA